MRFIVAAVFLAAGVLKLADPVTVADGIAAFHFFPVWMINPLALGMPFFEIFVGVGILAPRTRRAGALAACCLSFCFLALYASALARGLEVLCACFGKWEILQLGTKAGALRAALLFAATLWICREEFRRQRDDRIKEPAF